MSNKDEIRESVAEALRRLTPRAMTLREAGEALGAMPPPEDAADEGPRRTMSIREAAEALGAVSLPADEAEGRPRDESGRYK